MRHFQAIFVMLCLLFSLSACSIQEQTTAFFYLRSEFIPGTTDGVIAAENREITGDRGLNYNLRLYLEGPATEEFRSPFPKGIYLLSTKTEEDLLLVYLSPEFAELEDMDLTLACVCLAQTCFGLTDARQVTIMSERSGENYAFTLTRDSFTLLDDDASYKAP